MNTMKTALLLAAMTALFLAVGQAIGGHSGMMLALVMALGMNVISYWFSDRMVLSMMGAREVSPQEAPQLHAMVARLAQRAGMPMPRVCIMDSAQPNAFATGRSPSHAAVAATSGLLSMLSAEEIEGVMAHELAHIAHRDTLTMTITATLAGAIGMLANMVMWFGMARPHSNDTEQESSGHPVVAMLTAFLAPVAAMLVQAAISRSREFEADRLGAELCGNPQALASALLKIEQASTRYHHAEAEAHPAAAHVFISNPLSGRSLFQLFSTHPPTEARVAALQAMVPSGTGAPAPMAHSATSRLGMPSRRRQGPWG